MWGPDLVCHGGSITLFACGDALIVWSNSSPSVVSLSGNGDSATLQGLAAGTATITATDSNGKTGSKTVKVVRLGIDANNLIVCAGFTNTLVLTNADLTGVSWSPSGSVSPDGRTNRIAFTAPGVNIVTSYWNGCTATATAIVVQVASLTPNSNHLCNAGTVQFTAITTPPGYENQLTWTPGNLTYLGVAQRSGTFSTQGTHQVSVTCGASSVTNTITVHKVDITNTTEYGLAGSATPVTFSLSADSVGPFGWSVSPAGGPSVSGSSVTVRRRRSPPRAAAATFPRV